MGRNHQVPRALESFCHRFLSKEPALKMLEMTKQDNFPDHAQPHQCPKDEQLVSKEKAGVARIMAPPELDSF